MSPRKQPVDIDPQTGMIISGLPDESELIHGPPQEAQKPTEGTGSVTLESPGEVATVRTPAPGSAKIAIPTEGRPVREIFGPGMLKVKPKRRPSVPEAFADLPVEASSCPWCGAEGLIRRHPVKLMRIAAGQCPDCYRKASVVDLGLITAEDAIKRLKEIGIDVEVQGHAG